MTDILTKDKLFKEDINIWDGSATTGTRKTSTGGSQTLNKFDWIGIDALINYGQVSGRSKTTIQNVIDSISGTSLTSIFLSPGTWTIDENLTIGSNIILIIPPGAKMNVSAGITLTINGIVQALDYEIFSGSGTLDLSLYAGPFIFPSWGLSAASYITINGTMAGPTVSGTATFQNDIAVTGTANIATLDVSGTADIGSGTTRRLAPTGTFVDNSDGNPTISSTKLDIDASLVESAWESIGPTGSGADNVWTALDSVPDDASWIEIKIYATCVSVTDTANTQRTLSVWARQTGSAEAASSENMIFQISGFTNASGNMAESGVEISLKIPLDSSICFDAIWTCTFNSTVSIDAYLTGYGFNP